MNQAYASIGNKKRFRPLPRDARMRICKLYQDLRGVGYGHDLACQKILADDKIKALPWWGLLLANWMLKLLFAWWQNRKP